MIKGILTLFLIVNYILFVKCQAHYWSPYTQPEYQQTHERTFFPLNLLAQSLLNKKPTKSSTLTRLAAVEAKDIAQDARIEELDDHLDDHDNRLDAHDAAIAAVNTPSKHM